MKKEEALDRIMQLLHEINEVISREKMKKGGGDAIISTTK